MEQQMSELVSVKKNLEEKLEQDLSSEKARNIAIARTRIEDAVLRLLSVKMREKDNE